MRYRRLGGSELEVSVVGVGCNAFGPRADQQAANGVVDAALAAGITFFDTADMYGPFTSEEMLGRALGRRRSDVVIATKFGMAIPGTDDWGPRASRGYLRRAVEGSLRRLRTDVIDLYQLHQPDRVTPMAETMAALEELVQEGKVRAYGCSKFTGDEIRTAAAVARAEGFTGYVTTQAEYSLYQREAEVDLIPALLETGTSLLPYFPLAHGLLTGKYRRGAPAPVGSRLARDAWAARLAEADFDRIEALEAVARECGITLLGLAIGGLAAQPAVVSVIAGATSAEQVRANAAAGSWQPTEDDLRAIAAIGAPGVPADDHPRQGHRSEQQNY